MADHYFQARSLGSHNLHIIFKISAAFSGRKLFAGNRLKCCERHLKNCHVL